MKKMTQYGFSLIELLSIMVIVGLVAGISIFSITGGMEYSRINKEYEVAYNSIKREIDRSIYTGQPRILKLTNQSFTVKNINRLINYCSNQTTDGEQYTTEADFSLSVYQCNSDFVCNNNVTDTGICILPGGGLNNTYLVKVHKEDNIFNRWITVFSSGLVQRGTPQNSQDLLLQ